MMVAILIIMKTKSTKQKIIIVGGKQYKVTGHPDILHDHNSMVEVWVSENIRTQGHWRLLKYGLYRSNIVDQATRIIKYELRME